VNEYAVTVIGPDRPGIIAEVAEIMVRLGLNLTDSTMTRLRGQLAMTLVCAGRPSAKEIDVALAPLTTERTLLVTVRRLVEDPGYEHEGSRHVLTVHGVDRLGIVATFSRVIAEHGGNITDLTTRLAGQLYVVVAEVDVAFGADVAALGDAINAAADRLGVEATLRLAEADVL
jgi:glycine cleavage system transcriptional repressor